MTFSIAARCPRTGEFGCALATSSMAAGGRAPFVAPGVGVILSQARSDPRLGTLGLKRLEARRSAQETLSDMLASTLHSEWRQLGVLDLEGRVADFTGARCSLARGARVGDGALAIGNGLANEFIVGAMLKGGLLPGAADIAQHIDQATAIAGTNPATPARDCGSVEIPLGIQDYAAVGVLAAAKTVKAEQYAFCEVAPRRRQLEDRAATEVSSGNRRTVGIARLVEGQRRSWVASIVTAGKAVHQLNVTGRPAMSHQHHCHSGDGPSLTRDMLELLVSHFPSLHASVSSVRWQRVNPNPGSSGIRGEKAQKYSLGRLRGSEAICERAYCVTNRAGIQWREWTLGVVGDGR